MEACDKNEKKYSINSAQVVLASEKIKSQERTVDRTQAQISNPIMTANGITSVQKKKSWQADFRVHMPNHHVNTIML